MLPQEIIRRKRDGASLTAEEIAGFIAALSEGRLSEGQIAAFAMAVWFRGMNAEETVALTLAMRDSGETLRFADLGRPVSDKHSTGGVGDNVSLMLAPIVAACGLAVPMISGRGLGHTGGTLDKLESIPGYDISPSGDRFRAVVDAVGCAVVGQTAALAPADKRLYAIRDVTATVDSIPLITASILSKKLAAGLQSLVLDVKVGSGSIMGSLEEARRLADSLVTVANAAGLPTTALLTDMNEPLADAAGNALEIASTVAMLQGQKRGTRLETLVLAEAAEMLVVSGVENDPEAADERARHALASGRAADLFGRMVHALGGPADLVDRPGTYLKTAPVIRPVAAQRSGYLAACDARELGMEVVRLGGGRSRPDDKIDHRTGFDQIQPLGTWLTAGDPICFVHAADEAGADRASAALCAIYGFSEEPPAERPLVLERVSL